MAREYISENFGEKYLPSKPNSYASKSKNAQEAHEAIRATSVNPSMPTNAKMTESHAKLYDLIFRRFVASQMSVATYDITTILVAGKKGSDTLQARTAGSIITHDGWMKLFPGGDDTILPDVSEKDSLAYKNLITEQKFTQPPPRFNDASLVKELEKRGIGRPSTFASIISVILARGYVDRMNKAFQPTEVGKTVIRFLMKNFPGIIDYDFTANMEDNLDEVSLGNKDWRMVMKDFYAPFAEKLEKVEDKAERMQVPVEPLNKPCPDCGVKEDAFAQLMEKLQTMSSMPAEKRAETVWRETKNGELVIRTGRFGKFISCSRYPECEFTDRFLEKIDMPCPDCAEGDVVVKKSRKGRTFYGCSRYPDCDYASWSNPMNNEAE